jgi:hypothetical protein
MALRGWTLPAAFRIQDPVKVLHQVTLDPSAMIETERGFVSPIAMLTQLCEAAETADEHRSLAPWAKRLLAEWRLGLALADAQNEASEIWLEHALRRRILGQYLADAGLGWQEIRFWFHFLRLAERFRHHVAPLPQSMNGEQLRAAVSPSSVAALDRRLIEAGKSWNDLPRFRRHVERLWALDIELNRIVGGIADRQSRLRRNLGVEVISDAEIAAAEREPPDPTRALLRARMIREHAPDSALRVTWNKVQTGAGSFDLSTPLSRKLQKATRKERRPAIARGLGPLFEGLRNHQFADPTRIYEEHVERVRERQPPADQS